ncbi:MAG: hypothetical protein U0575_04530 [Phycisphaerales bacterium]
MSQFGTPVRRSGGEIDVYTALLAVAALVLAAGVAMLALRNIEHSKVGDSDQGGVLTLVK